MSDNGRSWMTRLTDAVLDRAGWGVHTARDVAEEVKVALRAMATPGGMRGVAMEAAWLTAHAVLYPWGAITE